MAKPNWREWLHIPEVRVWEACLLSLNLEPHDIEHDPDGWEMGPNAGPFLVVKSFPSVEIAKEYVLRVRVLLANLSNREHFSPSVLSYEGPAYGKVRLSEFAAWVAVVVGWEIPQELTQLAAKPQTGVVPEQGREPDKVNTATLPADVTHKLNARTSELAAEVEQAKKDATDASDHLSVFAALSATALKGAAPFTGVVNSRGIEYRRNSTGKVAYFSSDALRKRMKPSAR